MGSVQEETASIETDVNADLGTESEGVSDVATTTEDSKQNGKSETEPESVRDTVIKAYNEEKAKLDGRKVETDLGAPKVQKGKPAAQAQVQDTSPPVRLSAEQKEIFNALDPKLKMGVARMFLEHEREFTRTQQQLNSQINEVRGIHEAIQPFAAEWGELGYTVPQAIASLAATQSKLINPKTSLDTYIKLGADLGYDVSGLRGGEGATAQPANDISTHPQFLALQSELNSVKGVVNGWRNEQTNANVSQIVAEMSAVRDEQDQFGRYRFPKLHEPGYIESMKPLVSALVRTIPGLSYGEALKRAYYSAEGIGNSQQAASSQQTKFPETNNRAIEAASSVRGRSAPGTSGFSIPSAKDIPDSPADTVRMVYEQLSRGT